MGAKTNDRWRISLCHQLDSRPGGESQLAGFWRSLPDRPTQCYRLRVAAGVVIIAPMSEVTRILDAITHGDTQAAEQLLPLVYSELRQLAARRLAREAPGQTLQATALVHEAYVRLVDGDKVRHWRSRGHFFGAAAEAMRRILVERARHRRSLKAGGDRKRLDIADIDLATAVPDVDLLALNEALEKLERQDQRKAQLVKLRFFAGLTTTQVAEVLGISTSTADNDWAYARCWLRLEIEGNGAEQSS
jgi:RNA polymerase sigma factor (TIGR02999 family)